MFSDALAIVDDMVSSIFDEISCICLPKKRLLGPNSALVSDVSRAEFAFLGCFDSGPNRSALDQSSRDTPSSQGRHLNADIVLSALTSNWPYEPSNDDMILVCEVTYKISEVHRDGTSRILFYLAKVK